MGCGAGISKEGVVCWKNEKNMVQQVVGEHLSMYCSDFECVGLPVSTLRKFSVVQLITKIIKIVLPSKPFV